MYETKNAKQTMIFIQFNKSSAFPDKNELLLYLYPKINVEILILIAKKTKFNRSKTQTRVT